MKCLLFVFIGSVMLVLWLTSLGFRSCNLLLIFLVLFLLNMSALDTDQLKGTYLCKMVLILFPFSITSFFLPESHYRLRIIHFWELRPNVSNFQEDSKHSLCILLAHKLGSHCFLKEFSSKNFSITYILWEAQDFIHFW